MTVTINDIHEAAQRIKPYIHRTPVLTNESLNQKVGAQVFMKCENLQKIGAFKFRGARSGRATPPIGASSASRSIQWRSTN